MTGTVTKEDQKSFQDSLTRLPQLADASNQINLETELKKLREASTWTQPVGRSSATLVKYKDLRIVLTVLKQGARIAHHRAEGSISIQAILGRIRLYVGGTQLWELASGDILALQSGLDHDLEALEESAFLLTIASPHSS